MNHRTQNGVDSCFSPDFDTNKVACIVLPTIYLGAFAFVIRRYGQYVRNFNLIILTAWLVYCFLAMLNGYVDYPQNHIIRDLAEWSCFLLFILGLFRLKSLEIYLD